MACYKKVSGGIVKGGGGITFLLSKYSAVVPGKANRISVRDAILKDWLRACLCWEELPRTEVYDIYYKSGVKLDTFDRWVVWQNPQIGAFPRECGIGWIPAKKHKAAQESLQTGNMGLALQFSPDRMSDAMVEHCDYMGEHCRAVRLRLFQECIPARARIALLHFMKSLFLDGKYDDSIDFTLAQKSKIQYIEADSWLSGKTRIETSWRNVGNMPFRNWEHEVFDALPFAHIGLMQQAFGAYGDDAVYVPECTPMEYPVY